MNILPHKITNIQCMNAKRTRCKKSGNIIYCIPDYKLKQEKIAFAENDKEISCLFG